MRATPLILLFALFGATFPVEPARSDCLVDYANWSVNPLSNTAVQYAGPLAVSGNYAYTAGRETGLHIIDISNPSSPQIVEASMPYLAKVTGVAVSGVYAYVTDYSDSNYVYSSALHVIDVSDPQSPVSIGSVALAFSFSYVDLAVSGSFLYVPRGENGLQVIDVSNPAAPRIAGSTPTNSEQPFYGLAVSGSYAYVSGYWHYGQFFYGSGVRVIDISNPASPFIVGSVDNHSQILGLTVLGSHLYVADSNFGLQVIDVSNPATPNIVATLDTPGQANDVAVSDNMAYVADGGLLTAVYVSDPSTPRIIGSARASSGSVVVRDSLVYTSGWTAFSILPAQCSGYVPPPPPVQISATLVRTWEVGNPRGIVIDRKQAIYVTEQYNGLIEKFDSTGVSLGTFGAAGSDPGQLSEPRGIDIGIDGFFYVADYGNNRISVFDRDGIFLMTFSSGLSHPSGVDCESDGTLWVTDDTGLHHLSATGNILQVINAEVGTTPNAITADGNTLYVSMCDSDRLDKYTLTPSTKTTFPGRDIDCPYGSTLDADGNLWVCDQGHYRLLKYDPSGAWLGWFPLVRSSRPFPTDIAFDHKGNLLVANWGQSEVLEYCFECDSTVVPVHIASFEAQSRTEGILLTWKPVDVSQVAEFHLEKSTGLANDFHRINSQAIPATGPYEFLDTDVVPGTTYNYRLISLDRLGRVQPLASISVAYGEQNLPLVLFAHPNPFLGSGGGTSIRFSLPTEQRATLRVLDARGSVVRVLANERLNAGDHSVLWDGRDERSNPVPAGVYFYALETLGGSVSRKVIKLR